LKINQSYTTMHGKQSSKNKTYVGLHVKCPMLHWNNIKFACPRPSLDVQFS